MALTASSSAIDFESRMFSKVSTIGEA